MVAAIRCRLHVFWTWHEMTHDPRALPTLAESDYEAIELAVMETARGRWFLREYAARNRQADTTMLLQAINRLEGAVSGERAMEQIERIRFDLLEMAKSIAGLKIELDMHDEGGAPSVRHEHRGGYLHARVDCPTYVRRKAAQVATAHIGLDERVALCPFAAHLHRPVLEPDVGDLGESNPGPAGCAAQRRGNGDRTNRFR